MGHHLTEIADKFGTDKGSSKHLYTALYHDLLAPFRGRPINLLEFGLSFGGPERDQPVSRKVVSVPSVQMWQEYFPQAHVYGADISDCSAFQTDRFTFWQVDCGDQTALQRLANSGVKFDLIIDDGSHASFHQQLTLTEMFPTLKPGGLYIVEDLQWQPGTYERELPAAPKTADLFSDPDNPFWKRLNGVASIQLYTRDEIHWYGGKINRRTLRWRFGFPSSSNHRKLGIIRKAA